MDNTHGKEKESGRLLYHNRSGGGAGAKGDILSYSYVSVCLKSVQDNSDRSGILSQKPMWKNIMMFGSGAKG